MAENPIDFGFGCRFHAVLQRLIVEEDYVCPAIVAK